MKTITYNPETHALVPIEPSDEMIKAGKDVFCDPSDHSEEAASNDYRNVFKWMIAAAPQPEPNPNWCAGCSPDNCSGCWAEPVDSEPAMWVMKHIRSGDLAQAKPNQKALHPRMWSQAHLYTTPQPDRTAELEQLRQRVAEKDEVIAEEGEMLAMRDRQLAALKTELREICAAIDDPACDLTLTAVECIKKLKAENEWRDIETAPKDNTVFLAWRKHATHPLMVRYEPSYDWFANYDGEHVYDLTHWMPLPKPPAMAQGEQGC